MERYPALGSNECHLLHRNRTSDEWENILSLLRFRWSVFDRFNIENYRFFIPQEHSRKHPLATGCETNLCTLFQLHDRLFNISQCINDFYSSIIVVYVTVSFITAMFSIVFQITELFHYFKGETNGMSIMAASYVVWSIPNISLILLLLHTCENTRNMAYDTSSYVHKIIEKQANFMLRSDIFYCKLKAFSFQMLHCKRTFRFSGHGLFNFDYTFIFSVSFWGDSITLYQ